MSLAAFDGSGPVPPLADGDYLRCVACVAIFAEANPFLPHAEDGFGRVECPACGSCKGFTRHSHAQPERTVARRWPGSTRGGWTPMPNAFHRNARALGLNLADIGLIDALETYRRTSADAVTVSIGKLSTQTGSSENTLATRLDGLVERGLLEKQHRRRADGGNTSCAYTRNGLTRALALIDGNVAHGRDPHEGLPELLAELAGPHPKNCGAPTSELGPGHPKDWAAEEDVVEEEAVEEEPLSRLDSRNPVTSDEFIRLLKDEFDATELMPDGPEREGVCAYPAHRLSDWQTPDGRWVCGVCHPPAVPRLVRAA